MVFFFFFKQKPEYGFPFILVGWEMVIRDVCICQNYSVTVRSTVKKGGGGVRSMSVRR